MFRIVHGEPTAEELAALVTVLLRGRAGTRPAAPESRWARSARPGARPRWR